MRVVVLVRHHKRVIRQLIVGQVSAEVRKGNQIQPLHATVGHIREVRQRIMVAYVWVLVAANIAHGRQALSIALPRFAGRQQMPHNVVHIDGGIQRVVAGNELSCRQHEIIADGGMHVGVILCGQRILGCKAVEVRHGRTADDSWITLVFLQYYNNVVRLWYLRGQQRGHEQNNEKQTQFLQNGTPEDLIFVQIDESGEYCFAGGPASTALALSRSSEMSGGWRELMKKNISDESS